MRLSIQFVFYIPQDFNSRTHVECDPCPFCGNQKIEISTHALTWSATGIGRISPYWGWISTHALTWSATRNTGSAAANILFQLTHSRGVRHVKNSRRTRNSKFQLTHSRGVRHIRAFISDNQFRHFNSRTHVECDFSGFTLIIGNFSFQLTHSRGVRHQN